MAEHPQLADWKTFLESSPANAAKKIPGLVIRKTSGSSVWYDLPKIRIQLHCPIDGGVRWCEWASGDETVRGTWEYEFITYKCRDCGRYTKTYALLTVRSATDAFDVEVMKLGEYPPYAAPISQRVEKLLGKEDLELYRKGM